VDHDTVLRVVGGRNALGGICAMRLRPHHRSSVSPPPACTGSGYRCLCSNCRSSHTGERPPRWLAGIAAASKATGTDSAASSTDAARTKEWTIRCLRSNGISRPDHAEPGGFGERGAVVNATLEAVTSNLPVLIGVFRNRDGTDRPSRPVGRVLCPRVSDFGGFTRNST